MSLVDRAKNIITTPKTEWVNIAQEEPNAGGIVTGYVIPLALLPAIAFVIGYGVIGVNMFFVHIKGINWGLAYGLQSFVTAIIGVYITAFVVDALAPSFGSQKNFGRAMQLVAYSYTPAWIGGILNFYPAIGWLGSLFGIYGIYLLYLGFPHTMQTPKDKVVVYMIVTAIILVVVYFVLGAILISVFLGIFGLSMTTPSLNL